MTLKKVAISAFITAILSVGIHIQSNNIFGAALLYWVIFDLKLLLSTTSK